MGSVGPGEDEGALPPSDERLRRSLPPTLMLIEVAAAVIRDDSGRYLITRRREGTHLAGLWEFPGGKREPGESLEACLRRELREELSATFAVGESWRPSAGRTPKRR